MIFLLMFLVQCELLNVLGDQVYDSYPKAEIIEIRSERVEQMSENIQKISESLKKLNILERIKNNVACLPAC